MYLQASSLNSFLPASIGVGALAGRLVFAIDVAKVDMVAAIATGSGQVLSTISYKTPMQNAKVIELLKGIIASGLKVQTVLESTGTYGDVLRFALETAVIIERNHLSSLWSTATIRKLGDKTPQRNLA